MTGRDEAEGQSFYIALNVVNSWLRDWTTEWIKMTLGGSMKYYLLFGGWNGREGGASDFSALFTLEVQARTAGIEHWRTEDSVRLASWMHLAVFDPVAKKPLRVVAHLYIPGAENAFAYEIDDDVDTLRWIELGLDDPVYSAEA